MKDGTKPLGVVHMTKEHSQWWLDRAKEHIEMLQKALDAGDRNNIFAWASITKTCLTKVRTKYGKPEDEKGNGVEE